MSARMTEGELAALRENWEHDACTREIEALTDERDALREQVARLYDTIGDMVEKLAALRADRGDK